jgi:hypothetical protein
MKYDKETAEKLIELYKSGMPVAEISTLLQVPDRSIIAKLSSLGVYQRKVYKNKRDEVPVKKEQYIERIAALMEVNLDILESLEKANKNVLALIERALIRP